MSEKCQHRKSALLFDHLVGAGKYGGRHREAEDFCGSQINSQLKFGRLLHWKITSLFTLQNATNVSPSLMKYVEEICPIAKQATGTNVLGPRI